MAQLVVKSDKQNRAVIMEVIANSSTVSWHHTNFQGEFDFSEVALKNAVTFDMEKLLELELEKI